ncbi:hypothetical protein MHH60_21585 [Paenibacillus sp. FSL H7-0716]|uniref:Phosphodiester glycosidase domain-containing protein n=1 Tax=Paenibacillus odorifer TaxID=189426 RepID=A0AAD0KLH0_9BACL|nr:hypothetical protein [Paenibacillus odorifer]AWV32943.1 hypothetical protein CD191_10105 [Paenibacillus odorifer]OME23674.1 hypothetical protein BSK47_04295 [Paenibacillus odorifer]
MWGQTEVSSGKLKQLWRRRQGLILSLLVLLIVGLALSLFLVFRNHKEDPFKGLPHAYSFLETVSTDNVQLYMMSTSPEDIKLRAAGVPLRQVNAYGINGGFFYQDALLSMAIMNDTPVNGAPKGYGSGWFNAKYARGTLVWDGASRNFSVQVVSSGEELKITDRQHYFAQGGISMNLGHEDLWEAAVTAEHLPYADEKRLRSGMVYDNTGKLWLIVTPTLSTAAEFRSAILQTVPAKGLEGIFLDGDGSSQMNAKEIIVPGDSRSVVQMIAVDGTK